MHVYVVCVLYEFMFVLCTCIHVCVVCGVHVCVLCLRVVCVRVVCAVRVCCMCVKNLCVSVERCMCAYMCVCCMWGVGGMCV